LDGLGYIIQNQLELVFEKIFTEEELKRRRNKTYMQKLWPT